MGESLQLVSGYLVFLNQFHLVGLALLMAASCSLIPIPGEIILAPMAVNFVGALDAPQAGLRFILVVLASTLGSYLGAVVTYGIARLIGRPLVVRFGKYVFIPESKLKLAEAWVTHYGATGVFFARLLPLVRHIIGLPAGIVGMRFKVYSLMILTASFIWSVLFAGLGLVMQKEMLLLLKNHGTITNPAEKQAIEQAFTRLSLVTVAVVVVMILLYMVVLRVKHRHPAHAPMPQVEGE